MSDNATDNMAPETPEEKAAYRAWRMRVANIMVSDPFMHTVLQQGLRLPDGFNVVALREDPRMYGWWVTVHHPDLPSVVEGEEPPQLQVVYVVNREGRPIEVQVTGEMGRWARQEVHP